MFLQKLLWTPSEKKDNIFFLASDIQGSEMVCPGPYWILSTETPAQYRDKPIEVEDAR